MNEIIRILNLLPNQRTRTDIQYLRDHKEELAKEQLDQIANEKNILSFEFNKIKIIEDSDDTIMFSKPLTITDNSEQFNGTKYDINSMDISGYKGLVTVNHSSGIEDIVGKVVGLVKKANKVTIDGIKFAIKQNSLAQFAMDMLKGGFVTDFSIETVGPWANDEGVYENSQLVGLSMVIVGNNRSATVNQIAFNSIEKAKKQGLNTEFLEKEYPLDKNTRISDNVKSMFVKIINSKNFAIEIVVKNEKGEEEKTTLAANAFIYIPEDQKEAIEKQINEAKEPTKDTANAKAQDNIADVVKNAIEAANKPLLTKIADLEQKVFDNSAQEPKFVKLVNSRVVENKLADMDWRELVGEQVLNAWDWLKADSQEGKKKLMNINEFNLEKLKEAKKVANSVTISDFGNFVVNPELLTEIEGFRSDFQPILSLVNFRDTLSLQMAWLTRSGDINMQEVEMCDNGADGNLKPISEYEAAIKQSNLHELAAVTPVCDAATRFLAVDLLSDISSGYRTDFDRKKAQLLVARLQQAVDETGYKVPYSGTSDLTTLKSWADLFAKISERVPGGIAVFNDKTKWELVKRAVGAGISGPIAMTLVSGDLSPIFGKNYVVVPNELMPSLNSNETKTFVVEGVNVTINQAIFFFEPATFSGRTSGGLKYDLSTEAAYEVGGDVRSAFQRNELVLRGSFFRGGAIKDPFKVAGMYAAGVS